MNSNALPYVHPGGGGESAQKEINGTQSHPSANANRRLANFFEEGPRSSDYYGAAWQVEPLSARDGCGECQATTQKPSKRARIDHGGQSGSGDLFNKEQHGMLYTQGLENENIQLRQSLLAIGHEQEHIAEKEGAFAMNHQQYELRREHTYLEHQNNSQERNRIVQDRQVLDDTIRDVKRRKLELECFEGQLAIQQTNISRRQAQFEQDQWVLDRKQLNIESSEKWLKHLEQEVIELEGKNRFHYNKTKELDTIVKTHEATIESLTGELTEDRQEIVALGSQVKSLEGKLFEAEQQTTDRESRLAEAHEHSIRLEQVQVKSQEQLKHSDKEKAKLRIDFEDCKTDLAKSEQERQKHVENLAAAMKLLRTCKEDNNKLQHECENRTTVLAESNMEYQKIRKHLTETQKQVEDYNVRVQKLDKQADSYETQRIQAQREEARLTRELFEAKQQLKIRDETSRSLGDLLENSEKQQRRIQMEKEDLEKNLSNTQQGLKDCIEDSKKIRDESRIGEELRKHAQADKERLTEELSDAREQIKNRHEAYESLHNQLSAIQDVLR